MVLFWMILFTQLQASDQPNIVIILTDDQGYADVSYNPHSPPEVSTPHIDALAVDGVIRTNGYASGHVCSPTRAENKKRKKEKTNKKKPKDEQIATIREE